MIAERANRMFLFGKDVNAGRQKGNPIVSYLCGRDDRSPVWTEKGQRLLIFGASVELWVICISALSFRGSWVETAFTSVWFFSSLTSWSSPVLAGNAVPLTVGFPSPFSLAVDAGVGIRGSLATVLFACLSSLSGAVLFFLFFSSSSSSCPSSLSPSFSSSSSPSLAALFSSDGPSESGPWDAPCSVLDFTVGTDWRVGFCVAWGACVGQTELGKEEMTPPPTPRPASKVLVTTDATVAWLPLEEGPIPVAMETIEKWMPEDVQVEEPELMGAMSAEDAGDIVGWRGKENVIIKPWTQLRQKNTFALPSPGQLTIPVFTIRDPSNILVVFAEKQKRGEAFTNAFPESDRQNDWKKKTIYIQVPLNNSVWLKSLRRSCWHTACTRNRYSTSGETLVITAFCKRKDAHTYTLTRKCIRQKVCMCGWKYIKKSRCRSFVVKWKYSTLSCCSVNSLWPPSSMWFKNLHSCLI